MGENARKPTAPSLIWLALVREVGGVRGLAQEPGFGWGWRLGYVCVRARGEVGVEVPVPVLGWVGRFSVVMGRGEKIRWRWAALGR